MSLIVVRLASGDSTAEILADYPGLVEEDIPACIAYGSKTSWKRSVTVA